MGKGEGASSLKEALASGGDLEEYLGRKATNHNHYKYYSGYERIRSLVDGECLYLGLSDRWNDVRDRGFSHGPKGVTRFALCMSFSASESMAMWMLYGGVTKDGAMLELMRGDVRRLLGQDSFELGFFDGGRFERVQELSEGCRIYATDVLYCAENEDGTHTVKRSDERVDGLASVPDGSSVVAKAYPWNYENEVRIVLEVPTETVSGRVHFARLPLHKSREGLLERAFLAPDNTTRSGFCRSGLRGFVEWDLCAACERGKG